MKNTTYAEVAATSGSSLNKGMQSVTVHVVINIMSRQRVPSLAGNQPAEESALDEGIGVNGALVPPPSPEDHMVSASTPSIEDPEKANTPTKQRGDKFDTDGRSSTILTEDR